MVVARFFVLISYASTKKKYSSSNRKDETEKKDLHEPKRRRTRRNLGLVFGRRFDSSTLSLKKLVKPKKK
jgi:hypothetical protein